MYFYTYIFFTLDKYCVAILIFKFFLIFDSFINDFFLSYDRFPIVPKFAFTYCISIALTTFRRIYPFKEQIVLAISTF